MEEGSGPERSAEEGDVSVPFGDERPDRVAGDFPVVVYDFEAVEGVEAAVELNEGDMVADDQPEVVCVGRLFGVRDQDAVYVLVNEGLDGFAFFFIGLVGLADDEAVVVGETDFFYAGDGVGEEALIDMRNDDAHGPGQPLANGSRSGVVFVTELFGHGQHAQADVFANGRVIIKGFGYIGRGDVQLFRQVVYGGSLSAGHVSISGFDV